MDQKKVIEKLEEYLQSIRENIPDEFDLIEAYKKVIEDIKSYDYE